MSIHDTQAKDKGIDQGLRTYLRRHRRTFIMWVSLGVLISWAIKDVLVENARDHVAELSAARTTFYLRIDTLRFGDEIAAHINAPTPPEVHGSQQELEAALRKQLMEDFRADMVANHLGDAVNSLAKSVEQLSGTERQRVDEFYKENIARGNKFKAIDETLQRHAATEGELQTAKQLASDASYLDFQMVDLGTLLADRVDNELRHAKQKQVAYSLLAYASTLMLWIVIFWARRANIDGVPEGPF